MKISANLTDDDSQGPGERSRLGRRRVPLAPDLLKKPTGLWPHDFPNHPSVFAAPP